MKDYIEVNVDKPELSSYKKFVVKSVGNHFDQEIEKVDKKFKEVVETTIGPKKKLNGVFYYLTLIFALVTVIFGLVLFQKLDQDQFPVAIFVLMTVSLVLVILFGVLQIITRKQINEKMKTDEVTSVSNLNKELEEKLKKYLGVSEDALKVDVFVRQVTFKKGETVNAITKASYCNNALYSFVKDDKVYFSDTYELIQLEKKYIQDITLIRDKISFINWNKKEALYDKKFKPYGLRSNGKGIILVDSFYEIKIKINQEDFILRIPGYEIEAMKVLFSYEEVVEEKSNENK